MLYCTPLPSTCCLEKIILSPTLRPFSFTNWVHWPVNTGLGFGLFSRRIDSLKIHCLSIVSVASMSIACSPMGNSKSPKLAAGIVSLCVVSVGESSFVKRCSISSWFSGEIKLAFAQVLRNLTETRTWEMLDWAYKDELTCCPTNSLPISHQRGSCIKKVQPFLFVITRQTRPFLIPTTFFPMLRWSRTKILDQFMDT